VYVDFKFKIWTNLNTPFNTGDFLIEVNAYAGLPVLENRTFKWKNHYIYDLIGVVFIVGVKRL